MYEYHFTGLDMMSTDLKGAKSNIKTSMQSLAELYSVRPNAFLTRVFFATTNGIKLAKLFILICTMIFLKFMNKKEVQM